ncbi:MAG: hypothetical protein HXX18_03150 [Bacteroidetes bacterium]|nr:hypothetical protein [Bacteroidota bacterium]
MKTKNSMIPSYDEELQTNPIYEAYNSIIIDLTADFDSHEDVELHYEKGLFTYKLSAGQKDFFEKLYVVSNSDNKVSIPDEIYNNFPELSKIRIGKNEWQLIDFVTSSDFDIVRLVSIIAPIGRGKTSLLSFVFLYLREQVPNFKRKVIPIVINCHSLKSPLNDKKEKNETFDYLINKVLIPKFSQIIEQFIDISDDLFWEWYCKNNQTTFGLNFKNLKIAYDKSITDDYKDNYLYQIFNLKINEQKTEEFYYKAIEYVKLFHKKEIVIIFDNMDFLNIDSVQLIVEFVERLREKTSLKFILTLREVTSRKISEALRGTLYETMLEWKDVNSIDVINRRCDIIHDELIKKAGMTPLIINNKAVFVSNINGLIFILLKAIGNSSKLIELFANQNMRLELKLLRVILRSGLLSEYSLNSLVFQFSEPKNEINSIPEYLILESIVTNNFPTYVDSKRTLVPGLLNILSINRNPFILDILQLIMLTDLIKHDNNAVDVANMKYRLNDLFLNCDVKIFDETFYDVLAKLINTGLAISPETYEITISDNIKGDVKSIIISDLGLFYMKNLLFNYNYLVHIKDSVNLANIDFQGTSEIRKHCLTKSDFNYKKYARFNLFEIGKFLIEFGNKELEILSHFKTNNRLYQYQNLYCIVNENLYSIEMLHSIIVIFNNDKFGNEDVIDKLVNYKKELEVKYNEFKN